MSREFILSPSLLSCDFGRMAEELEALEAADLKWVHWDVMDGRFVPNITLGPPIIGALRKTSKLYFDVHLMIEEPERYVEEFAKAGADMIVVHAEATNHLERICAQIKDLGKDVGVALNPATPVENIRYLIPQLDMALIMSVNPGFGGQGFIPFSLDKIKELAALRDELNPEMLIQVDGGCTPENTPELVAAGADCLVSGSAFFKFPPLKERHQVFKDAAKA
ncbi:ribulose-phosphate 3-epimerase [Desulfovibrio ferrophilus]|uniref:Ribulose-phosphate 3-epimerase n=1 Tax=Desulfovibrio ferrophilus TaxID=241368 RepID=A0A2Z6AZH9_9BACT|nr:ribulose-phosphate 3-epimerase [Desulfovibrio ferrophilus]BBD08652.1 ribulose-phosphate 3-epimerase [Desulfovibrio ferrophilus]